MLLGVNVDHIATIRQARKGIDPEPVMAATLAILGGADGITVHLREDRRHIQDRDLKMLKEFVPVELNLEMAGTKEMIGIASQLKPDLVTLVPEKRQELTTEGGLAVKSQNKGISETIKRIQDKGIPVSLFINPDFEDITVSKQIGADMVEIHTGMYANTKSKTQPSTRQLMAIIARHNMGPVYSSIENRARTIRMLKTALQANVSTVSARGTTREPCRLLKKSVAQGRSSV